MTCPKCNSQNNDNAHFCTDCGTPLNQPQQSWFKKRKGCLIALSLLIFLFFVFFVGIISFFAALGPSIHESEQQKSVISGSGENKIAVINIDGVIVEKDPVGGLGSFSEETTSSRRIKKVLSEIERDSSVKAVLLRVNSPGGSAAASEEIYSEITDFKRRSGKVVVAYFSDLAASGGYYVAMASDEIVANPSNITGSIGVIISYLNVADLAEKYGVRNIVYKSGPHKDIISEFRQPTEDEQVIMQSLINDAYDNFVQVVSTGRKISELEARGLADGRVYSAKQAQSLKLIDKVGHFEDAVSEAKNLAKIKNATVVEYGQPDFLEFLLGSINKKINFSILPGLEGFINLKPGPSIMYIYQP